MDVLLGSRAETSQATSCHHLPLPAQPRQTGPAGVRKSPVDIIITKKTAASSNQFYLPATSHTDIQLVLLVFSVLTSQ